MAPHTPTIRDVAARAGVSISTVSRVLNGQETVNPTMARRVQQAAEQLGYAPNPAGRALRRRKTDAWAAIVPELNTFFTGVVAAFESVAIDQGRSVLLCNSGDEPRREQRYIDTAIGQRMSGVIIAVAAGRAAGLHALAKAGIPTVLLDRRVAEWPGDGVYLDNEQAGRLAAEHLLAQGFRQMACITGPESISTTDGRLAGFAATLHAAGRPLDERYLRRVPLARAGGEQAMRSLLAMTQRPDAVYVATGPLTVGAFEVCQEYPRPPIAIVGNDDEEWTTMVRPRLTVIRQPMSEFGRSAAQLLSTAPANLTGREVVLAPRLIVRESSLRSGPAI